MMSEVIFDADGHATQAGYVRVYHFAGNGECLGWSDKYINIGVGLPGSSTMIPPGEPISGMVSVFNGTAWNKQEDHRGQTVYSIADRHAALVDYIGAIKDGFVTAAPTTKFDKWDGMGWVEDTEANVQLISVLRRKRRAYRDHLQTMRLPGYKMPWMRGLLLTKKSRCWQRGKPIGCN